MVSTGSAANGTLSGDTINGTHGKPPETTDGGTWNGAKGNCAK